MYSFVFFLSSSRWAAVSSSRPMGAAPLDSMTSSLPSTFMCQCCSTSEVLAVKNFARMFSVAPKRTPENSSTAQGFSAPSTVKAWMLSATNRAISSFLKWPRMNSGKSTVRKSWNCQHTTCGTLTASFLQLRHGRSASHLTLRAWQQKQAPSRRTCSAFSLVSLASGPLRPFCVVRIASKHSNGLCLPACALMDVGVTMTNLLPPPSGSLDGDADDDDDFFFSTRAFFTLRIGIGALLLLPPADSCLILGDCGLAGCRGLTDAEKLLDGERRDGLMSSMTNIAPPSCFRWVGFHGWTWALVCSCGGISSCAAERAAWSKASRPLWGTPDEKLFRKGARSVFPPRDVSILSVASRNLALSQPPADC